MFREEISINALRISGALLVLMLLASACGGTAAPTASPTGTPVSTPAPSVTKAAPTSAPTPVQGPVGQGSTVTVNLNGAAQSVSSQVIAAVPASAGGPYWEVLPRYDVLTLSGYPITNHLMKPQVFIYPAADLATANQGAGQIAADLKTLLQNQQAGKYLPFLPLFNAQQIMHAQVKYLDFKSGQGVRFLTQFDQAPLPINNRELIYTYQGLTRDGKYYVAVVLPINLATLPADEKVTGQEPPEFRGDFQKYVDNVVNTLNQQSAGAFSPDLSKLDAMIQSIEIK